MNHSVYTESGLLLRPHRARMSDTAGNFGVSEVQQCCTGARVPLELIQVSC